MNKKQFILFHPDDSLVGIHGYSACKNCTHCYNNFSLEYGCYFSDENEPYAHDCIIPEKISDKIYPNRVYLLEKYDFALYQDSVYDEEVDVILMKFILINQVGIRNYVFLSYFDGYGEFQRNKFYTSVLQIF